MKIVEKIWLERPGVLLVVAQRGAGAVERGSFPRASGAQRRIRLGIGEREAATAAAGRREEVQRGPATSAKAEGSVDLPQARHLFWVST